MARHVVKRDGATSKSTPIEDHAGIPDKAPIPGGASGEPGTLDPNPASTVIHGLRQVAPAPALVGPTPHPPRQYRVVGIPTTGMVMFEGALTRIVMGKTYPENAVDLDYLRAQGVKFEAVNAEGP
jgi:hypothetical protein